MAINVWPDTYSSYDIIATGSDGDEDDNREYKANGWAQKGVRTCKAHTPTTVNKQKMHHSQQTKVLHVAVDVHRALVVLPRVDVVHRNLRVTSEQVVRRG
jgi:hypothetical protein